ncbi:MAG: alkaline phosphatase family protein [Acidobacteria bacterium]|nr:alkaline phosphatase family protein [Acidobacteriota bacterium]
MKKIEYKKSFQTYLNIAGLTGFFASAFLIILKITDKNATGPFIPRLINAISESFLLLGIIIIATTLMVIIANALFLKKFDIKISSFKNWIFLSFLAVAILVIVLSMLLKPDLPGGKSVMRDDYIYIIGVDGASWDIINPLLDQGKLPTLASLIKNGCKGILLAPEGYVQSGPSWTSIATGLDVQQHKVTHNYGKIRTERVWNIADYFGISSVVVNWICSPRPEIINGAFITGPYDNPASYPEALLPELENKFGKYFSDVDSREISDRFLKSCFEVTRQRTDVVKYLLDKYNPHLLAFTYTSSDRLMHFFWQYYQPAAFTVPPPDSDLAKYRNVFENYYISLDKQIGEIVAKANPEKTTFIVLSDHGFGPENFERLYFRDIRLNLLFEKTGLRKVNRDFSLEGEKLYSEIDASQDRMTRKITFSTENSKNIPRFVQILRSAKMKADGKPLFKNITNDDRSISLQMYERDYRMNSVDVTTQLEGRDFTFPLDHIIDRNKLRTGDHRREGILILSGNKIKKGLMLKEYNVTDITPTILALFNLPLSKYMRGEPIYEAMTKDHLAAFSKRLVKHYLKLMAKQVGEEENTEETEEKLRSLGYIN